jgi:hypothetical protein
LSEKAVKLTAGGVEGTLLLLGAVVNERATVLVNHATEELVSSLRSQRRVVVQVPDDFSTQQPKIVHMAANGFRGKRRGCQVFR